MKSHYRSFLITFALLALIAALFSTPFASSSAENPYHVYFPIVGTSGTPLPITNTPRPTAVTVPGAVYISQNTYQEWPGVSAWVIPVGVVQNDSPEIIYDPHVQSRFYGADGQIVGQSSESVFGHAILPGAGVPFRFATILKANWITYSLGVTYTTVPSPTTAIYTDALRTVNIEGSASGTEYYIAGQLQNDTATDWGYPWISGALYDASGKIMNASVALPSASITASQIVPFSLQFIAPEVQVPARYELSVVAVQTPTPTATNTPPPTPSPMPTATPTATPTFAPPVISSIVPTDTARLGEVITLNGSGFGSSQSAAGGNVIIGGVVANSVYSWSSASIVTQIPLTAMTGTRTITVIAYGTSSNNYSYAIEP